MIKFNIATTDDNPLIKDYCDHYHYHYKKYTNMNQLIKDSHFYDIIFLPQHHNNTTYGFCYKTMILNHIKNIQELDQSIRQLRPHLFDDCQYNSIIPKTIHFMWLSEDNSGMPDKYKKNIQSFKDHNDYNIKIWDYDKVDLLIKQQLPEFYDTFKTMTPWISKCDFARFCVIYILGGIYSDCDFYCTKSLNKLLNHKEEIYVWEISNVLCNGFFASTPKSKFIYGWLNKMKQNMDQNNHVLEKTGPRGLGKYYHQSSIKPMCLPTHYILPYEFGSKVIRREYIDQYYVYTLWDEGSGWNDQNLKPYFMVRIILYIIFILFLITIIYPFAFCDYDH